MPKIDRSICRYSARASATPKRATAISDKTARVCMVRIPLEEVADVQRVSDRLPLQASADVPIDGKLHAPFDRVVPVDAQRRGSEQDLVPARFRKLDPAASKAPGFLARQLDEQAPIPMGILLP